MDFDPTQLPRPTTAIASLSMVLETIVGVVLSPQASGHRYTSSWNLVVEEGCTFLQAFTTELDGHWPVGSCYSNARRLVREAAEAGISLVYVEGYVLSGAILFEHGWTATPEGVVLDPTLGWQPCGYVGVPLDVDRVEAYLPHGLETVVFGDLIGGRSIHDNGFADGMLVRSAYPDLARLAPEPTPPAPGAIGSDDFGDSGAAEFLKVMRSAADLPPSIDLRMDADELRSAGVRLRAQRGPQAPRP